MKRKIIITENPEKALWWRLSHFKNVDRVIPLVESRHSSTQNAKKQAQHIRYCLEQAEEYFHAAQAVTIVTKPLLLYYGMANLAWALILFKKTGDYALDRLPTGHQEHGLERPHFQYKDRNLELPKLLDIIRAAVPPLLTQEGRAPELRGTLGLLLSVLEFEPAWVEHIIRKPGVGEARTSKAISPGIAAPKETLAGNTITLGQLLLMIPDMATSFGELGIHSPLAYCTQIKIDENEGESNRRLTIVTLLNSPEEIQRLRECLPTRPGAKVLELTGGLGYQVTYPKKEQLHIPRLSLLQTLDGRLYLYVGGRLAPECFCFIGGMFLLGMLVRYYPHVWMHLLDRQHPLVNVIEAFIPLAQRKYPNLILDNLTGDSFSFRHP